MTKERLIEHLSHLMRLGTQNPDLSDRGEWLLTALRERGLTIVSSADETSDDSATLTSMADRLRAIANRDESQGLSTTGLENAAREIEWAARRVRGTGLDLEADGSLRPALKANAEPKVAYNSNGDAYPVDSPPSNRNEGAT